MFDINSMNLLSRLLGVFFYYSPRSESFELLKDVLIHVDELFSWKDINFIREQSKIITKAINDPELSYQHSILFEGQDSMPVPPWGSVYLDKENLLMGESTERYRIFLQNHHLRLDTGVNEPEDQFGLMLMAISLLLESDGLNKAKELMCEHILYLGLLDI